MDLQNLVYVLELGAIYALFALGLSLAWGMLDVLNLAHGALFVLGGFTAYRLAEVWPDAPFPVLLLAGTLGAGVGAVLLEVVAFGPIRSRFKNRTQIELATLASAIGAGAVIDQLIRLNFVGEIFPVAPTSLRPTVIDLGIVNITDVQIFIILITIVLAVALDLWVRRSSGGLAIRAVADAPRVATMLGVSVHRVALGTMLLCGALAGFSGVLYGATTSGLSIESGHSLLVKGFAVVVVGGVGSIRGTMAAAFLLGLAEVLILSTGLSGVADGVAFGLIILFLLIRPQGLFSRKSAIRA